MAAKKASSEPLLRRRKTHRKSRAGCRNCKLRRVKCDESRPACRNCIGLLVICNYDSTPTSKASLSSPEIRDDDLKFSVFEADLANDTLVTVLNQMVDSQYPRAWSSNKFRALDKHDIERLNRWHARTVFTLGPDLMSLCYQLTVSKHATQHPYLLHAALAMAALHEGTCPVPADSGSSENNRLLYYYHSSCAAALFNERLSKPAFKAVDRNAIWATASLLGNMACSSIESYDPELSWPLSSLPSSSLDWMVMHRGMAVMDNLCGPGEPGGIFHELLQHPAYSFLKNKWTLDSRDGVDGIPPQFIALCGLSPASNAQNCPYHAPVRALSQIWDMESTKYTAFRFLPFISLMSSEMKALLDQKDARAMLLLAYWYTKMFHVHSWWHPRAVVGCAAICIYLRRYHCSDAIVMGMLQYPLSKLAELDTGIPSLKLLTDAVELSFGTAQTAHWVDFGIETV